MPNGIIGFVYLWMDSGRHSSSHPNQRMFCLGSHQGAENDGYLTSTGGQHFKASYRKRPQDFKRRIIERIYEGNGKTILKAEQRWLNFIKPEELIKRYYNRKKTAIGWSREDILLLYETNPEFRINLIAGQRAAHEADPTIVIRRGATWHALYESDPTLGLRIGKGVRAAHKADPTLGQRMGIAISPRVSAAYKADPTNRQRASATRRATYKANPKFGLQMSASQRAAHDADPTLGVRKSARANAIKAKMTPEQRSEISLKGAKTYRTRQNEVILTFALWLLIRESSK